MQKHHPKFVALLILLLTTVTQTSPAEVKQTMPLADQGIHVKSVAATTLPPLPEFIFGVNQYNVGAPAMLAKGWPLSDAEAVYLKSIGCNTIKFPLYPSEIGIDEKKFMLWSKGDRFEDLGVESWEPDWRSLDTLLDWMVKHQFTPFVCPGAEAREDWNTKAWMSLHVPEEAKRAVWFTNLVVDHVTAKYGDNVIYGWYENWWWNSYKHEKSAEFPTAFRTMLSKMYSGKISTLNDAWKTDYRSFDKVEVPKLLVNGDVAEEAINSIRTYDLRRAMDLMQRQVLLGIKERLSKVAPKAIWSGGCMLGELGGLNDIRSVRTPRTNATMRTCAATSGIVGVDIYAPRFLYYSYYRIVAKISAAEEKRFSVVEAAATKPETFGWIAEIGGPTAGTLAWAGKEDAYGFIKFDGTRREENLSKFKELIEKMLADPKKYREYKPGHIRVYFPEETYYYSITKRNSMDAYQHVCDHMSPEELEPVLTDELIGLPSGSLLYVLERTLPLKAIKTLQEMGDRVICPHEYFVDEFGQRHDRKYVDDDFYARLLSAPDGGKLLDVFQRVEEKENNVACRFYGTTISSSAELAAANCVVPGRENILSQLIDGSIYEGVTFADKPQKEVVALHLLHPKTIYGAFVQFYEGDGQEVKASLLPSEITVSTSMDGMDYSEVATISGRDVTMRPHIRFKPVAARHVIISLGENTRNSGLKIEELGILGQRR